MYIRDRNKAERNHRPSIYGHFTPKSYYDKEITDTVDDGKIAAVGILKDFQFAFSGLMGGQGVHSAEKAVQMCIRDRG